MLLRSTESLHFDAFTGRAFHMFKIIAAAALVASSFAASAATNLVQDGSFESTATNSYTTVFTGQTPWTTSSAGLEIRNDGTAGTAQDLTKFAELDTSVNSWISQDLATVDGQSYKLTFYVEDRPGTVASTNGLSFNVSNASGNTFAAIGSVSGWTEYTYWFTGSAAASTLTFTALGTSDGYGSSLDNISVTAVPEANPVMMMAAGLGLLGLARRRARK
jgi:hypothetical protein